MSTSPPPPRQQDICYCYVKVGVLRNWKQLFLSVTYSVFIGAGVRYLFVLISHLSIHEVPTKHPRGKILDPRNIHEKKFWTHEITMRKNLDPQRHGGTMAQDPQNLAYYIETREISTTWKSSFFLYQYICFI